MAGFRLFTYNPYNGEFYIEMHTLKLTKEFNDLWLLCKKQCKCEDVDDDVIVGNQDAIQKYNDYCKYIFLTSSWASPYYDYDDDTRLISSMNDSMLDESDIKGNEVLEKAIGKFNEIQSMDRNYRLLNAAKIQINDLISYFEVEGKLNQKVDGKPVYKSKDILDEIRKIGDVSDYLDKTEERVKKGELTHSNIKGDATEGFVVDFVRERERREKELQVKKDRERKEREEKRKELYDSKPVVMNPSKRQMLAKKEKIKLG